MKQKLLVRMLGAIVLVVTFSNGHATRCCLQNKQQRQVVESILPAHSLHFTPLDIFKW